MGLEIDCRETKNRVGLELGGEVVRVAAGIRTNTRAGERRPLGNIPNILFTPREPVTGDTCTYLGAAETTAQLEYVPLPPLDEAHGFLVHWQRALEERLARDAQEWEIRVAEKYEDWARLLVETVERGQAACDLFIQAIRVNDIVITGMNAEMFFETGLEIRARSPFPDTFALGYANGTIGYLPRAQDYPPGGWAIDAAYAVPDLIFQVHPHPVALHPASEQRAVDATLTLIRRLAPRGRS